MPTLLKLSVVLLLIALINHGCLQKTPQSDPQLSAVIDQENGTISIFRLGLDEPVLIQNAKPDFRPYLHPIAAPDGQGKVTEYSPGHHKHQTGLFWGFTRVNGQQTELDSLMEYFYESNLSTEQKQIKGRDYFHNTGPDFWKRMSFGIIDSLGAQVSWQTVYHLLGEDGEPLMEETQVWSMKEQQGQFLLELEWNGKAIEEVTIGEMEYGGLFLRMPWQAGIKGEVINFARQKNQRAEGQRALWLDVGMQVAGRDDRAHVAIFDHPENRGFPQIWRVDNQLGVGPVRARMGDWKILKGETEIIKHGFVIYTGELDDLALTEQWKKYVGDESMYSTAGLWEIAQKEGYQAKFLTAEEQVAEMTMVEGNKVNAWASEPMITQPMAFCWDDKGRMWIAENRDYENRGEGFSGSGDSRILILEDTDRDGKADKRSVFAEGIPFPSALAVGFGGVFVGAPPNLLFIPDINQDDKADMNEVKVLLTGWGIRDRHETINSLHWGPDGWLYGLEGFATPSKIRKPIGKGKLYRHNEPFPKDLLEAEGVDIDGGVWRYHPTKDRFEVVAHGFSNPWGIDHDAKGRLFISACVIPHLFHVVPGGIYHRQGGQHFNPYVYDDIKTIVDHRHRSAHGGARIYQSDAFPAEQQGRIFMANIHEHAVLSDQLKPVGSGFVASHGEDFLMANNAQWIGFSMEIGPEGALYVLDWHDADICGNDVVHKNTGRIYRITPEVSAATDWKDRYHDLGQFSDLQLAELQISPSDWHSRRARLILQARAASGVIDKIAKDRLFDIYQSATNADHRLRALWTLHITKSITGDQLEAALDDNDEFIRAWAVQMLVEDHAATQSALARFESMAKSDPSASVRLNLSAALQRIPIEQRWAIATRLAGHSEDAEDHNIPKMIWFALEENTAVDVNRALIIAQNTKIPILSEYISRRAIDAGAIDQLLAVVQKPSPNKIYLLKGLRSALEGRTDIQTPSNWTEIYSQLKGNRELVQIALEIGQLFGDAEAAKELFATIENKNAPVLERQRAINTLASRKWEGLAERLPEFMDDPDLTIPAIRAITHYNDEELGWELVERFKKLDSEEQQEAFLALASRRTYGNILVECIKNEWVPKDLIPAYVARQLRRVVGSGFVEVWGPIDDISDGMKEQYKRYETLLDQDNLKAADIVNGKALFARTCGACHKMYNQGGEIGPDLTGSNRTSTDYLLSNILEPSAEIQDDYKMVVITVRDGRTYLGNVANETERQLTLRVVGQDKVVINKSEIQSREETPNSMMPQGLLNNLSEKEVIDLVGYLQIQDAI
jgi:putative membrane-bound dehydrogenase-like protein